MKYNNTNFMQLSRSIFQEPYCELSRSAKWLFVVLNELEQRFTGGEVDWFFRSNEDLANDCGFSLPTLKRAKEELLSAYPPLVESWQTHFIYDGGVMSERHITAYRIIV